MTDPLLQRLPPHSMEAEQAVLSSMLMNSEAIDLANDKLKEADFYFPAHQTMFTTINALRDSKKPIDFISVATSLRNAGQLEMIGGPAAINVLQTYAPSSANVVHYAEIVAEKAVLRGLIATCSDLASRAYDPGEQVESLIADFQGTAIRLGDRQQGAEVVHIAKAATEAITAIERRLNFGSERVLTGIAAGLAELDKMTGGWQSKKMILISGKPGDGKSSLARQFLLHAAVHENVSALIFTYEMPINEIVEALIWQHGKLDSSGIRYGMLKESDIPRVTMAAITISNTNVHLVEASGMRVGQLRSIWRKLAIKHKIGMVIVDYAQRVAGDPKQKNREQVVAEISGGLKDASTEMNCPVFVLTQLNKDREVRESESLWADADIWIDIRHDEPDSDKRVGPGAGRLVVRKQRGGPTGSVRVTWLPAFTTFEPCSEKYVEPDRPKYRKHNT